MDVDAILLDVVGALLGANLVGVYAYDSALEAAPGAPALLIRNDPRPDAGQRLHGEDPAWNGDDTETRWHRWGSGVPRHSPRQGTPLGSGPDQRYAISLPHADGGHNRCSSAAA
jgi:hypothetical protein